MAFCKPPELAPQFREDDARPFVVYGNACGDDVIFDEEVTEDPKKGRVSFGRYDPQNRMPKGVWIKYRGRYISFKIAGRCIFSLAPV